MKSKPAHCLWLSALAASGLAGNLAAQDAALIAKGKELFEAKICTTCHQVTGGPPALAGIAMKAPKFEGDFWGKERTVTLGYGGKDAKATFDEAYFIESIRDPMGKVVKTSAAPMPPPPTVNDEEMKALVAYVKSLSKGNASGEAKGIVAKGAIQDFNYRVYNGVWDKLPDFDKLKPVKVGKAKSGIADTNFSKKRDNFGIVIEGRLEIKKKGKYTFRLGSDDGSRLFVNGERVVDNDGIHGVKNQKGTVKLKPGIVDLRIEYFERGGGEHLSVDMSGPGIKNLQLARNTAPKGGRKKPPIVTGHPIVPANKEASIYRNFIEGASPRGIGVGYPEGINLCFDANVMNFVMAWHGAFMDGARHWNGRGQGFQPPSGHYLVKYQRRQAIAQLADDKAPWPELKLGNNDDDRAKGLRFRGYKLLEGRRPVFLYTAGETSIEDYVTPHAGALPSYTRQITIHGKGKFYYLAAADDSIEKRGGSWKVGKTIKLTLDAAGSPVLRDGDSGKELLVPIHSNGKAVIRATYEWDLN